MSSNETSERLALLQRLGDLGLFSPVDLHFAAFVVRMNGGESYPLYLAAALLSRAVVNGKHICLDLASLQETLAEAFPDLTAFPLERRLELVRLLPQLPIPSDWPAALQATGVVAGPGGYAPLILNGNLLYLQRYWRYEQRLAQWIRDRCGGDGQLRANITLPPGRLLTISRRFTAFTQAHPGEISWQAVAVLAALRNRFTVITGGPGTGKTTVAAAVLALYRETCPHGRAALVAPTGKAQARLGEALRGELPQLNCSDEVRTWLAGLETSTIHRLLGVRSRTPDFRHDRKHPLELDLLMVDEASMVSMALMTRLFDALPPTASVVLLGDREQLASVEAGAVLASICAAGHADVFSTAFGAAWQTAVGPGAPALPTGARTWVTDDSIVALRRSYRFAPDRGIARVKEAIGALASESDPAAARTVIDRLENDPTGEVKASALPDYADGSLDRAVAELVNRTDVGDGQPFSGYLRAGTVGEAFRRFGRFRILCSHRGGPYGVDNLNRLVEKALHIANPDGFYPGLPLMVTENDYILKLYNGDVGLVWPDAGGVLRVYFPDYAAGPEQFRCFSPYQLPPTEKVFALTVHKAQGSGFGQVLLVIPDLDNSPILTRELIYTGLTRAMRQARIWYRPQSLTAALLRPTARTSDLCRAILADR